MCIRDRIDRASLTTIAFFHPSPSPRALQGLEEVAQQLDEEAKGPLIHACLNCGGSSHEESMILCDGCDQGCVADRDPRRARSFASRRGSPHRRSTVRASRCIVRSREPRRVGEFRVRDCFLSPRDLFLSRRFFFLLSAPSPLLLLPATPAHRRVSLSLLPLSPLSLIHI